MFSLHPIKAAKAAFFCGLLMLGGVQAAYAQGANWTGYTAWSLDANNSAGTYNAMLPAHPYGTFTSAQIMAQTDACTALENDIKQVLATRQASANYNATTNTYTVPPNFVDAAGKHYNNNGFYRAPDTNAIVDFGGRSNFTLNAPSITFILKRYHSFFSAAEYSAFSNITVQGSVSAPLTVDADDYPSCQGTIQSYNATTGALTFKIMPGYDDPAPSGGLTAYTPQGGVFPNGHYQSVYGAYSGGQTTNAVSRIYQVTADINGGARYAPGNLVAMQSVNGGGGTFGYFWGATAANLTLKDINCGLLGPMMAGVLGGNANFTRFRNGPLPGTSRLSVAACTQTYGARAVTFDGCEFGDTNDDSLDIQGNGFQMFYQGATTKPACTTNSNQILVWNVYGGIGYNNGDTISIYSNSNFGQVVTAKIVAPPTFYTNTSSANITDATNLWNSLGRRNKSNPDGTGTGSLVLLTLDTAVTTAAAGDYLENDNQRMTSFTMTNCCWRNVGTRVMIEGINQGSFTHNTFDGVDGGLALVSDPYWAQGGTCQHVTISNNVFKNCKASNVSNTKGALVLGPLWNSGPLLPGQTYPFQDYTVTYNTFTGTGAYGPSLYADMLGGFKFADNLISDGQSTGISLTGCGNGVVFDNSIVRNNGTAISVDSGDTTSITQNYLDDTASPAAPISVTRSTNNVTQAANTTPAMIPLNRTISLKAGANGQYVCADNSGSSPLIANRSAAGAWEKYTVKDAGSGNVSLVAQVNNNYVSAAGAGASPLIANQKLVTQSETFQWIALDGSGDIGLRSRANGQYVCADNYGSNPLIANRTSIGSWETFLFTLY